MLLKDVDAILISPSMLTKGTRHYKNVYNTVFGAVAENPTQRLVKYLFDDKNYDKRIRPVLNVSTPTQVDMLLYVAQVLDMDERKQTLKTNVWLTFNWVDENLVWDPKDWGGLQSFKIVSDIIWMPDITLYNCAADFYLPYMNNKIVVIYNNGRINWASPAIFLSHCKMQVTNFPFDEQHCKMKFGPWQHDGYEVILDGTGDPSIFSSDGEWDMQGVDVNSSVQYYPDAPGIPYYDVTYTIHFSRRSGYYVFHLLLPCILISGITVLVFILPADSGEKVSLGITVLLSLTVFLLLIAESMPPSSDVPVIGHYYAATMLMVSLSVVLTIIVLNLHHCGPYCRPVPKWLRKLALFHLARWLLLDRSKLSSGFSVYGVHPLSVTQKRKVLKRYKSNEWEEIQLMDVPKLAFPDDVDVPRMRNGSFSNKNTGNGAKMKDTKKQLGEQMVLLRRLLDHIRFLREHFEGMENTDSLKLEWRQVALVIDRVFMIIYIITSVCTIATILLQAV